MRNEENEWRQDQRTFSLARVMMRIVDRLVDRLIVRFWRAFPRANAMQCPFRRGRDETWPTSAFGHPMACPMARPTAVPCRFRWRKTSSGDFSNHLIRNLNHRTAFRTPKERQRSNSSMLVPGHVTFSCMEVRCVRCILAEAITVCRRYLLYLPFVIVLMAFNCLLFHLSCLFTCKTATNSTSILS